MRLPKRALTVLIAASLSTGLVGLGSAAPAAAHHNQIAMIEDDIHLLQDPQGTLKQFRSLGAQMVRVFVNWAAIAPNPFDSTMPSYLNPTDPATYPNGAWDRWDAVDRIANRLGMKVDFVVTGGAPHWGQNSAGEPSDALADPNRAWFPNPAMFGQFVQAVGKRYSGTFADPQNPGHDLPRVRFWSIWNEPNFGEDLAPQGIFGSKYLSAPGQYRALINASWNALHASGHGHDKFVIGEFAARGLTGRVTPSHPEGLPGNFGQTKPLQFIRTMYCLDNHLHALRGRTAAIEGCPTNRAGTRRFRGQNPGLFMASAFSDHPYPQDQPPTKERSHDPDFAAFSELPKMQDQLDRIQRFYGSHKRYSIYNDEYGYITKPPNRGRYVSPKTAASYINWAEYLSWQSGRISSTMQYLLYDPTTTSGGFASGLVTVTGRHKATYDAYRMPLYLPSARPGRSVEVWGCVRPAPFAKSDTHRAQFVSIQFRSGRHGSWTTIRRVKLRSSRGYFDVHLGLSRGSVRLEWSYPHNDANLPSGTIHSRTVSVG